MPTQRSLLLRVKNVLGGVVVTIGGLLIAFGFILTGSMADATDGFRGMRIDFEKNEIVREFEWHEFSWAVGALVACVAIGLAVIALGARCVGPAVDGEVAGSK